MYIYMYIIPNIHSFTQSILSILSFIYQSMHWILHSFSVCEHYLWSRLLFN